MRIYILGVVLACVCLQSAELSGQVVTHAFVLDQIAQKDPEAKVTEDPLYVLNGVPFRGVSELDSMMSDYDLSFDTVFIDYLNKEKASTTSFYSDVILITALRHTQKRRHIKKALEQAKSLFNGMGHYLQVYDAAIFKNNPVVFVNDKVHYSNRALEVIKQLRASDISNIIIIDSVKTHSDISRRVNGLVRIRLKN